jgi:hypothetical protein
MKTVSDIAFLMPIEAQPPEQTVQLLDESCQPQRNTPTLGSRRPHRSDFWGTRQG